MPSTIRTGAGARPKPQTKATQKPAAAPATPAPTPADTSMFDDAPPAPPAAEPVPVVPAAPSEPPAAPVDAPVAPAEGGAQEQPAPAAPVVQEQPEPTPPPPPPSVDDTARDPVVEQAMDAIAPPPAPPARVRLGRVEGALHRVPLAVVQMLLADSESRIAALQSSPTIASLQARVRASEGRCAPIIFTLDKAEGPDAIPRLFAGLEGYVAALNLAMASVYVVTIDAGDAGAAQSHLASWANGRPLSPTDGPVEFLD